MTEAKVTVKMTAKTVGWRVTRWGVHPHYACKRCHYATHDLKAMRKHARDQHPKED
jgi:hypothetical protein